jgi:hypothetical protein
MDDDENAKESIRIIREFDSNEIIWESLHKVEVKY